MSGSARYIVTDVDDTVDGEWVTLPVDFKWTAGNVIDMGEVDVSLHPVSTRGDAYFDDEKGPTPRFVESNNPHDGHFESNLAVTTLLFPYVTNQAMASIPDWPSRIPRRKMAPAPSSTAVPMLLDECVLRIPIEMSDPSQERSAVGQSSVSRLRRDSRAISLQPADFEGGYGFAFITNGYLGESTLAQGYLAVCTDCDDD